MQTEPHRFLWLPLTCNLLAYTLYFNKSSLLLTGQLPNAFCGNIFIHFAVLIKCPFPLVALAMSCWPRWMSGDRNRLAMPSLMRSYCSNEIPSWMQHQHRSVLCTGKYQSNTCVDSVWKKQSMKILSVNRGWDKPRSRSRKVKRHHAFQSSTCARVQNGRCGDAQWVDGAKKEI